MWLYQWAALAALSVLLLFLTTASDERVIAGRFERVPSPVVHRTYNHASPPVVSAAEWQAAGFAVDDADDAAARGLVAALGFGDVYDRLPNGASRADLYRYAVVYARGGWYADQDVHPTPGLLALATTRAHVFFHEACGIRAINALKHSLGLSTITRAPQYKNSLFAAPPRWPPLRLALHAVRHRLDAHTGPWTEADVINVSGPGVLTDVLHVLHAIGANVTLVPCARQRSLFLHESVGSWRGQHLTDGLPTTPDP
ncbi:MAG: glycosyltransferase [Gammaproteobacteria bacterium]